MARQRLWQPTNTHMHTDRYICTLYNMKLSFHIHTRSMHLLNTHITSHSRALCFLIIIIIGRRQSSMWFCGYGRLHLATHRRGLPEVGGVSGSAQSSIQFGGHLLHLLTAAKCICSCIYVSVDVSMYLCICICSQAWQQKETETKTVCGKFLAPKCQLLWALWGCVCVRVCVTV